MHVDIKKILVDRAKTIRWLSNEVGCNYASLWKLCNNKSKKIDFVLLEKICKCLECGVEDVLVIEKE